MSFNNGPTIVTNGLVLALDAGDKNSYVSGSTTWFDLTGVNNGTLTNGPTFNSGSGGSIVFDGVDDYVLTLSGGGLLSFTVSFWVKTTETRSNATFWQRPSFFGKSNVGAPSGDFGVTINSGYLGYWTGIALVERDNSYLSSILINDNTYRNIAVTNTGTLATMYLNGTLVSGSQLATGVALNSENFWIGGKGGSESPGSYTNCSVSNVQFYNRALSAQEVLQNYNATKGRFGLT
jgi:hypothetical protein